MKKEQIRLRINLNRSRFRSEMKMMDSKTLYLSWGDLQPLWQEFIETRNQVLMSFK